LYKSPKFTQSDPNNIISLTRLNPVYSKSIHQGRGQEQLNLIMNE